MARDTLPVPQQVLDHLERLGVVVPNVPRELTTDAFFALWRDLAAADERPDLGVSIGLAVFGRSVASIAALQAPTVGDAIRTIGRYKRLVCPEEVTLDVRDGEAGVCFDWTLATTDVPTLLVDAIFTSHCALLARATAEKAKPLRIELARRPRHAHVLRGHFGTQVVFSAPRDRIVFREATLAIPLVTADRAAYERILPGLEAALVAKRTLVGDVRIAIARTMSAGTAPNLRRIAARLDTSARTLQRRLERANTTFAAQLEEIRHLAARRLLRHTELPVVDIAFLLGFEEQNSFSRAFRTWERTTPLRWRAARA